MAGILTERQRSHSSIHTDTTWRYSVFGPDRLGKGAVLFTGPDGIRDHRVRVEGEHRYVGEGTMSLEGASEVDYLWRAPSWVPHPRPKSHCVGEIGWGIPNRTDWSFPQSGVQIKLGEFRQAVEDRHTHLFQNAWYPGPGENIPTDSDAGLVMNVYQPPTSSQTASNDNPNKLPPLSRHGSGSPSSRHSEGSRPASNMSRHSNNNNNNNYSSRYHSSPRYSYY